MGFTSANLLLEKIWNLNFDIVYNPASTKKLLLLLCEEKEEINIFMIKLSLCEFEASLLRNLQNVKVFLRLTMQHLNKFLKLKNAL